MYTIRNAGSLSPVGKNYRNCLCYDRSPIATLDVELFMAQPLHELDEHLAHLRRTHAGPCGRVRKPVTW